MKNYTKAVIVAAASSVATTCVAAVWYLSGLQAALLAYLCFVTTWIAVMATAIATDTDPDETSSEPQNPHSHHGDSLLSSILNATRNAAGPTQIAPGVFAEVVGSRDFTDVLNSALSGRPSGPQPGESVVQGSDPGESLPVTAEDVQGDSE